MAIKLKPIGYRVIAKLIVPKTKIILTDEFKSGAQEAEIISIGSSAFGDWKAEDRVIKVGDKVLLAQYAGQTKKDEETGDIFRIINDIDIVAKIED